MAIQKSITSCSNTYPEYKDSGVEWLGEIPKHWELEKSKYMWTEKADLATTEEHTLLSVSQYTGVGINSEDSRSDSLIGYKKVNENDLVINIMLAWLGGLGLSPYSGVVSPSYAVYQLVYDADPKFLHYLYRTKTYLAEFARKSTGVVPSRWRMYTDDFGQVLTLLPPKEEQTAIAHFLNRKTEQIDQAIEIKQKQIELLKERQQILIHNAVTRGLNPDTPLKPSGVDWIGAIPEHWEVKKLKFVCRINQKSLPENYSNNKVKYVDIGNVSFNNGIEGFDLYDFKNAPSRARRIAYEGDTIISTVRTYLKAIDYIDDEKSKYIFSTGFAVLSPFKNIYPQFLASFVRSDAFTNQVRINSKGMSYPAINSTDLSNLFVAKPPIVEQKKIVEFIDKIHTRIGNSISNKKSEILKLKEYKTTLINSAVTGKIKVS